MKMIALNWFPIFLFFMLTMILIVFMSRVMWEDRKQRKLHKKN